MSSSIIDIPKKGNDEDQLGIDAYKNGLTSFISTAQTPLTIAIQGEWGSGKTSLLNSINYDLCGKDKPFYSIWINTWEYSLLSNEKSTMINIITGIINSVISILEEDQNENVEKLKKKAISFLKSTTKSTLKAGSTMFTGGIANDAIDEIFNQSSQESTLKSLHQELQTQINKCLNKNPNKKGFLFFIDDLDRINPPVAVQILELLKNIFDLENCIFLLAIDYEVVVKGLEPKFGAKTQSNEREFRSFFEKIIQLPFTMPVGQYKVDNLIIKGLQNLNYFDNTNLSDEIKDNIVKITNLTVGANPRAIKRLLNSLSLVKSITRSVNQEQSLNIFEELINIGVFSIQISYPTIYKALERYPNFSEWNDKLVEDFKLEKLNQDLKTQLEKNEFFDEEWEQVLYQLCQSEKFLSNRAMKISRLLNLIISIINKNVKENGDELEDISLGEVMNNAIQISSVTSFNDHDNEHKVEDIHKSSYLKQLRNKINDKLHHLCKEKNIELISRQKMVKSNLTYIIIKEQSHHRLDFSIRPSVKDYTLTVQLGSWYYVKAIHKDFQKNLDEEYAKQSKARERYENTISRINELKSKLPENYFIHNWVSKNDNHNTVVFRMDVSTQNAWFFLNQEEEIDMFINYVVTFIDATKDIKIVRI